jgi:hypothetical protein
MLPVSDTFLAVIRSSHTAVITATLCDPPGQTGVTPTGTELKVVGGSVTLDGDANVRGTLDLTVTDRWPDVLDAEHLTPYGAEVFITRGVELGNGSVQRAPLGYFRLQAVEQNDAPSGTLQLTGQDRMSAIIDARFETPVQFLPASTYGAVVEAVVTEVYPGATIEWDDDTESQAIGRSVVGDVERFDFLDDVVKSVGKIMFWDYRGHLVIKDPPDPTDPVWEVSAGRGGVLVQIGRALSREGVYNAVVATGEALDDTPPFMGTAYDLDPGSTTYWHGPFGKVPRFYSSPLLTSDGQCVTAAESLLLQSTGLPYTVDFTALPNPALEPFDPVRIVYPPDLTATPHVKKEVHVVSSLRIPLTPAAGMPATTRKVKIT